MNANRILFVFAASLFLSSCFREKCRSTSFWVGYSGFDSTELAVVVLKKYEATKDFSRLLSTDTLDLNGDTNAYRVPNSIQLYENYDWTITLPHANRTDFITE